MPRFLLATAALTLAGAAFASPTSSVIPGPAVPLTYLPVGAQANVSLSTILAGGWTQCYAATMNVFIGNQAQAVTSACSGDLIMMAGRETGSTNFLALAQTTMADALTHTGQNSNTLVSNGAQWWYDDNWSWGFTGLQDAVYNNECNVGVSVVGMCLHTVSGAGGYRINNITGLNGSTSYEKVFFVARVPEPAGLALTGLALVAAGAWRRRKSQ